jgi:hypothetical protein
VAVDAGRIVGFRTFVRWEFTAAGKVRRAVRAVDTATHPDYQGRGIFSALTHVGLEAMRDKSVDFVFNTPNDKSRPGYLKMGWHEVGRLPVSVRVRSAGAALRMARARVPAEKWSTPCQAGVPASEALDDHAGVSSLLAAHPMPDALTTRRTPAFLSWRYGFEPLKYRAILAGREVRDGLVIFRTRRRGPALEAVVCDVLVPEDTPRVATQLCRSVVRASGADYALRIGGPPVQGGFVRLPRQGPILTWRGLRDNRVPALPDWQLTMGDVELF